MIAALRCDYLIEDHLDSEAVIKARDACCRLILHRATHHHNGHHDGFLPCDFQQRVKEYRALSPHDRERVLVLLMKQPEIATHIPDGKNAGPHFYPRAKAPEGAFNILMRAMRKI